MAGNPFNKSGIETEEEKRLRLERENNTLGETLPSGGVSPYGEDSYQESTDEELAEDQAGAIQAKDAWLDDYLANATPEEALAYSQWRLANTSPPQPIYGEDGRVIGLIDPSTGIEIKNYDSLWGQLDEAKDMGIPDLNSWMDEQNYGMFDPMARDTEGQFTNQTMQEMQGLINQLTQGPTAMELGDATAYAEQVMGMEPGSYADVVGGLRQTSEQNISQFEGLSDEERDVRGRANRADLRNMEERATSMIDNIRASTGSVARAYATADQAISQINDVQLQQSLAMYQDDYLRKGQESDKAMQRYQMAVQNGQMSQAQYLDILNQNKSLAFQGYATQVNTMMQQNQQYLQQYQADAQAIEANINNIYKAIQMEIGIDEKSMNDIERAYQMEMAPILTQMDVALQQIEMEQAKKDAFWGGVFDFLSLGATVALGVLTLGVAPAVAVGAGAAVAGAGAYAN